MNKHVWVNLAANEWCSNTSLRDIAQAILLDQPGATLVTVNEHGGWYEDYGRLNGRCVCVGTANDAAMPSDEKRAFWRLHGDTVFRYAGTIDRNEFVCA